jgi:hypothetical protein
LLAGTWTNCRLFVDLPHTLCLVFQRSPQSVQLECNPTRFLKRVQAMSRTPVLERLRTLADQCTVIRVSDLKKHRIHRPDTREGRRNRRVRRQNWKSASKISIRRRQKRVHPDDWRICPIRALWYRLCTELRNNPFPEDQAVSRSPKLEIADLISLFHLPVLPNNGHARRDLRHPYRNQTH